MPTPKPATPTSAAGSASTAIAVSPETQASDAAPSADKPAAQGPGGPQSLSVNLPAAKVTTQRHLSGKAAGKASSDASSNAPSDASSNAPTAAPDLRLPHERDQSAVDSTATAPDPMMVQAAKDLADGQVDTDLHNQGGLDSALRHSLIRRER